MHLNLSNHIINYNNIKRIVLYRYFDHCVQVAIPLISQEGGDIFHMMSLNTSNWLRDKLKIKYQVSYDFQSLWEQIEKL